MEKEHDFQKIGKRTTFTVPDGFFEIVTYKTLQKAKKREQSLKRGRFLWKTLAMAASLIAFIYVGFYHSQFTERKLKSTSIENNELLAISSKKPIKQENITPLSVVETTKVTPDNSQARSKAKFSEPEILSDVLAELPDDELMQMATLLTTDPFIDESIQ